MGLNRAVIANVVSYTCAFAAMISQNVCCEGEMNRWVKGSRERCLKGRMVEESELV